MPPPGWDARALAELRMNQRDERSSEWMYRTLAGRDRDGRRRALLAELARHEAEHAQAWERLLAALGEPLPRPRPLPEHRFLVSLSGVVGVAAVLPVLHRHEVDGIAKYQRQAREWTDPRAQEAFRRVLPEEVAHEVDLLNDVRRVGTSRGALRSAILGANDGLASTLALVAGVAAGTGSSTTVAIAGAAGLVAGAFSMTAANYVSVKAERELHESQARLAREAVAVAPGEKSAQARAHFVEEGLSEDEAARVAKRLEGDPDRLVGVLLAGTPGLEAGDPARPGPLAAITGFAFASAALVPLLPFLFLPAGDAVLVAVVATGLALFLAGVTRSLWTLFPFARSGLEMVAWGLGSAAVTYVIGLAVGHFLGVTPGA